LHPELPCHSAQLIHLTLPSQSVERPFSQLSRCKFLNPDVLDLQVIQENGFPTFENLLNDFPVFSPHFL
jgi:hypothetical protein